MQLPNGSRAIVDIAKLKDYCLSSTHPEGRHKARVFRSALGLTRDDAAELMSILKEAASEADVFEATYHPYGTRYVIDFELKRSDKAATIRSSWLIRTGEIIPRLITCYVIGKRVLVWPHLNS